MRHQSGELQEDSELNPHEDRPMSPEIAVGDNIL